MQSQPSILTVLISTIILTCPWWIPIMQDLNKRIEHLEKQKILTQKRIDIWNNLVDSYDPIYGDFDNHIFLWLTHNSHYNNNVDWWDYRIVKYELEHFFNKNYNK